MPDNIPVESVHTHNPTKHSTLTPKRHFYRILHIEFSDSKTQTPNACRLVPKTIMIDSIMPCLKAMREGLGKTLPLSSLSMISPAELRSMLASDEAESES